MNLFFVGDELVAGKGDPKALGWTGRVVARTMTEGLDLTYHSLGVPGETIIEMASRWEEEVVRRVRTRESNAIVFAAGRGDSRQKSSLSMVRLSLASSLDTAKGMGFKVMLIGPPPGTMEENDSIAELGAICEEAAARRGVPYVDAYGPLVTHEQWLMDMATSTEALPGSAGYGLLAWLILHAKWREWLGLPTDV
jgi:acyl-CoA thioesterase-1